MIVEDMASDPRFSHSAIARDHGIVSALSVRIERPDDPFGVLATHSTSRRAVAAPDVSFVQAVANVLARARSSASAPKSG